MNVSTNSKEQNIQEAIRLVQECNYSRRKAASSTRISPNTLKRRLNGSIPREEYLERTKKITASEELILENMIIALIQQGEHIKSSALRSIVALYIQNKNYPSKLDPDLKNNKQDLELIPKGWCTRFMKRSKNLTVSQGLIEIKDKTKVPSNEQPSLPAFASLMKPPTANSNETLADTTKEIASNASTLIEGFRQSFQDAHNACTTSLRETANPDSLLGLVGSLSTIFNDVITLASVLNMTSHVAQLQQPDLASSLKTATSVSSPALKKKNTSAPLVPSRPSKITIVKDESCTPEFYNSATPMTSPSPLTPVSPSHATHVQQPKMSHKRSASMMENQTNMLAPQFFGVQQPQLPKDTKRQKTRENRSVSWSGDNSSFFSNDLSQWPLSDQLNIATTTAPEPDYFSQLPVTTSEYENLILSSTMDSVEAILATSCLTPSVPITADCYGLPGSDNTNEASNIPRTDIASTDYSLAPTVATAASTFDSAPFIASTSADVGPVECSPPVTLADLNMMLPLHSGVLSTNGVMNQY